MHLGPNFWPLGPHRAGPMRAGQLEVEKYDSVGHYERFGTPNMVVAIAVGWIAYHPTRWIHCGVWLDLRILTAPLVRAVNGHQMNRFWIRNLFWNPGLYVYAWKIICWRSSIRDSMTVESKWVLKNGYFHLMKPGVLFHFWSLLWRPERKVISHIKWCRNFNTAFIW